MPESGNGAAAAGNGAAKAAAVSPVVKGAAGSMGGLMEACCLQPIDVIKTRLQLDKATPPRYAGIIDCGSKIYTQEGVAALWKGLVPFSTHLTLKYALRMSTNAGFQSLLRDRETGELTQSKRLLAGFGASRPRPAAAEAPRGGAAGGIDGLTRRATRRRRSPRAQAPA